jgi:hypothetical protein
MLMTWAVSDRSWRGVVLCLSGEKRSTLCGDLIFCIHEFHMPRHAVATVSQGGLVHAYDALHHSASDSIGIAGCW